LHRTLRGIAADLGESAHAKLTGTVR
jgi:hypothetical protein